MMKLDHHLISFVQISGSCFDDWLDDDTFGLSQSIQEVISFFDANTSIESARGIEVDMDAIAYMVSRLIYMSPYLH